MDKYVVTGGSGFLGRHLVDTLLAQYESPSKVVVFDLLKYEHDDAATADRVEAYAGSVTKLGDLIRAFAGARTVFHCVSANPLDNKNERLMWSVNVDGTKNVIEACKQCNVKNLIYISSASVVFDGSPLNNITEDAPYPRAYIDYYSKTKAEAEKLVLAANKPSLLTCALRPSSIFGERDPLYVPRIINAGKQKKSRYIIGNGKTKWEFTYVGNVTHACIQADKALTTPESKLAGQAYFITNDENVPFWKHMGIILSALGYDPPSVCIPFIVCFIIASILDFTLLVLSPIYKPSKPPNFSKQRVMLLSTDRSISCEKAKRDFGYKPPVSMDEANRRTIEYFKPYAASAPQEPSESKKDG